MTDELRDEIKKYNIHFGIPIEQFNILKTIIKNCTTHEEKIYKWFYEEIEFQKLLSPTERLFESKLAPTLIKKGFILGSASSDDIITLVSLDPNERNNLTQELNKIPRAEREVIPESKVSTKAKAMYYFFMIEANLISVPNNKLKATIINWGRQFKPGTTGQKLYQEYLYLGTKNSRSQYRSDLLVCLDLLVKHPEAYKMALDEYNSIK